MLLLLQRTNCNFRCNLIPDRIIQLILALISLIWKLACQSKRELYNQRHVLPYPRIASESKLVLSSLDLPNLYAPSAGGPQTNGGAQRAVGCSEVTAQAANDNQQSALSKAEARREELSELVLQLEGVQGQLALADEQKNTAITVSLR